MWHDYKILQIIQGQELMFSWTSFASIRPGDGQGWPGMARGPGDVARSVETMGWFGGKHSPNKGGKAKGCHWLLVGFDGLSFLGVAIYMMSCMMHVETSQTNSMLAVETDSQCSQCYVHVLSLFLLLIDDSLGDYSWFMIILPTMNCGLYCDYNHPIGESLALAVALEGRESTNRMVLGLLVKVSSRRTLHQLRGM